MRKHTIPAARPLRLETVDLRHVVGGFLDSGVSTQNRVVERHDIPTTTTRP